jgi:hypothetical protein
MVLTKPALPSSPQLLPKRCLPGHRLRRHAVSGRPATANHLTTELAPSHLAAKRRKTRRSGRLESVNRKELTMFFAPSVHFCGNGFPAEPRNIGRKCGDLAAKRRKIRIKGSLDPEHRMELAIFLRHLHFFAETALGKNPGTPESIGDI